MDRPQCSDVEKGKIIALRENGLSIGEISASLQKSKSTINRWIRRYEMKGQVGKRRRPGGLTKKTTEVQDEEFRRATGLSYGSYCRRSILFSRIGRRIHSIYQKMYLVDKSCDINFVFVFMVI
ncbi:Transposase [Popillia japonica]|uniref:Transposase n=1 Tax=Popillia japonica TaxID=7064 RepID=A0AAW1JF52_POPJA